MHYYKCESVWPIFFFIIYYSLLKEKLVTLESSSLELAMKLLRGFSLWQCVSQESGLITDATYSCGSHSIFACFNDASVCIFTATLQLRCRISPAAYLHSVTRYENIHETSNICIDVCWTYVNHICKDIFMIVTHIQHGHCQSAYLISLVFYLTIW